MHDNSRLIFWKFQSNKDHAGSTDSSHDGCSMIPRWPGLPLFVEMSTSFRTKSNSSTNGKLFSSETQIIVNHCGVSLASSCLKPYYTQVILIFPSSSHTTQKIIVVPSVLQPFFFPPVLVLVVPPTHPSPDSDGGVKMLKAIGDQLFKTAPGGWILGAP